MRSKNQELMKQIIQYVEKYDFENHRSPTIRNIAAEFNIGVSTAYTYLTRMDEEGMLDYSAKKIQTRGTRKADNRITQVPVLGSVVCGSPELAEEDFEEFVALPVALFGEGDFFILRTHGDSMIEAGIEDGDMVVVKKTNTANPGDKIVALIDNKPIIRTLYQLPHNHQICLPSENSRNDCDIYGVVCYVIKRV